MALGLSTHLAFPDRLSPSLLNSFHLAGASTIEIFAARHHFDYTQRSAVRELANWFASNPVTPTMHMPIFTPEEEADWSRHTEPTLNLISTAKGNRIAAMDEVKRALEAAEQIPFRSCVLHLGLREDRWSSQTLDYSLSAVEHLKAFAGPLKVQLLLENLVGEFATPAHLLEITRIGHFHDVGFCLDIGHAHLAQPLRPGEEGYDKLLVERLRDTYGASAARDGLVEAFDLLGSRIAELHLHDNSGARDDHAWPSTPDPSSGVDWGLVRSCLANLTQPVQMLEISFEAKPEPDLAAKLRSVRRLLDPEAPE